MKKRLSVGKRLAVMGTVLAVTGGFWGGQSVLAVDNAAGTGNGVAIGTGSVATQSNSVAVGGSANVTGGSATAVGNSSQATFGFTTAIGHSAKATALNATALGYNSAASGQYSTALGSTAKAQGLNSIALGKGATTSSFAEDGIVIGNGANVNPTAKMVKIIAIGASSNATGNNAIALGGSAKATANYTMALGSGSTASATNTMALGNSAMANKEFSIAVGSNAKALGKNGVVMGYQANTTTLTEGAIAIGNSASVTPSIRSLQGIAIGESSNVNGNKGMAIGGSAKALANFTTALGAETEASVANATAVGATAKARGEKSTALGQNTEANGQESTALGAASIASGLSSIALGSSADAVGGNSIAVGTNSLANNTLTMAMGQASKAYGTQAMAIGVKGEVAVGGYNAIAMGYNSYVGEINETHKSVVTTANPTVTVRALAAATDATTTDVSPIDGNVNYKLSDDYYPVTINDKTSSDTEKIYENSIAIGMGAKSFGFQTLAIGGVSEAHDSNTIAVGLSAIAQGHYSVAMGQQARTSSDNALAIGHYAESHGEESTAIGYFSRVGGANNIALGNMTRLQGVDNSVALGSNARSVLSNSVAIGNNSAALIDSTFDIPVVYSNERFSADQGVVSVGNMYYTVTDTKTGKIREYEANTRRIINVAGGYADTDAVNVAQLKAALKDITIEAAEGITVNRVDNKFTIGLNVVGTETPTDVVTVTPPPYNPTPTTTTPSDDTQTTQGESDSGDTGTTTPTTPEEGYPKSGSQVTIGVETKPIGIVDNAGNKTAVTPGSDFSVVGGNNITTTASEVTVNGTTVPKLEVALNKDLTGLNSVSTNGLTIKGADGKDTVVIKGDNISMGNNIIHDVKAGVKDNDAVNVSQLRQEIQGETRVSADGAFIKKDNTAAQNITALDNQVQANSESISSINDSITNLNGGVSNLSNQVSKLDNRLDRVGAGAAALAALHPQDFDPSAKWDFAAGYGNYKGTNAVALGAFYRPTNDVMFSMGTSMGGGENMFNAGVSIKFGSSNEYSNYSKSALAEVVSNQASTIENLNNRVAKQEQENQELRAQIQEILNQLASK
ncbi:YadA-like family protein [Veillonella sp.]|uniref:YadA-like family protein n=3 Tax=Veillonella sp. TaxID=1926307 RepID=UPI0025F0146A|nr:YadA-like family protein [Veillonella sp.]